MLIEIKDQKKKLKYICEIERDVHDYVQIATNMLHVAMNVGVVAI